MIDKSHFMPDESHFMTEPTAGRLPYDQQDSTAMVGAIMRDDPPRLPDALHYLALLEQKTNALDQAAALVGWELPAEFAQLRRRLEARLSKRGKREYVQVLRLLETFSLAEVARAVSDALRLRAISFDAVKHLLLCHLEERPPRLDLENYPHLPVAHVANTAACDYLALLTSAPEGVC